MGDKGVTDKELEDEKAKNELVDKVFDAIGGYKRITVILALTVIVRDNLKHFPDDEKKKILQEMLVGLANNAAYNESLSVDEGDAERQ
jgi:hypothetical protein